MKESTRICNWTNTLLEETAKLGQAGLSILQSCGKECSTSSEFLKSAKLIRSKLPEKSSTDERFNAFKTLCYNKNTFTKVDNKITLIFEECTCPLVKNGIKNRFLCNCTIGYTKNIFETLFNKPVEITLVKSILNGDDICRQDILII